MISIQDNGRLLDTNNVLSCMSGVSMDINGIQKKKKHFGQQTSSMDAETLFHHKDEVHCTPGSFYVHHLGLEEATSSQEQFVAQDASSSTCNVFRPGTIC